MVDRHRVRGRAPAPGRRALAVALALLATAAVARAQEPAPPAGDGLRQYQTRVKPLLQSRCYACHGGLKQKAGLRLDTAARIRQGGDSGPSVEPGAPDDSPLLDRVASTDTADRMPPEHEGEPLTADQVAALRAWVMAGAPGPDDETPEADPRDHWAFRPIVRPAVPASAWGHNPIDAFLAAGHAAHGLTPQPEATRPELLRRLSFDLIGLPPTPDELAAFARDSAPGWYERAVERLLLDPRHGERWARHWMDVWRYSDWWGLGDQLRNSQKHIWHWRDWIVESLNANVPYDAMVRAQLAADELAPDDLATLRAGGFLARNYFLFNRHQWMDETVEHVGKAFLGLTLNCAKCHDHKYDPLAQTDYYRMRAIFEPYHVRLDALPGEPDLARDGLPRAFDGELETPTYRFVRGNEASPDQSSVMEPAIPKVLAFEPLRIAPVDLPAEAWQPGRRAWIADDQRRAAEARLAAAEAKLAPALAKRDQARQDAERIRREAADAPVATTTEPAGARFADRFDTLDTDRWRPVGGDWSHAPGALEQRRDGATRAALRLIADAPRDFEATVRLTIRGGSQWRSVGLSWDTTAPGVDGFGPEDSEQSVYISGVEGGNKIQAAWHRGGQWQYPGGEGMLARPIALGREHTLRVQVRDTLVNAWLDGERLIAYRFPGERRPGALQVTTFDALAAIHEVTLAPLPADAPLVETRAGEPARSPVERAAHLARAAELEEQVAERAVEVARAEVESLRQRGIATRDLPPRTTTDAASPWGDDQRLIARAAARAERAHTAAKAGLALAEAELKAHTAPGDQEEATAKALLAAREAAEAATKAVEEPSEQFTPLAGAQWTPTRFKNSTQDDPTVTFPPRSTGRRKALAEWITDPRNPLAARVAVNHIWARHLGTPLVATTFDFGRKGSPPTHPALLDWLAAELIASGWDLRHLDRLIVTSAAYRLSSSTAGAEANLVADAENVQYWRRTPGRLESQAVRDAILALAGTLDPAMGGPSVPPNRQDASRRRSLYFFHSNNDRNLLLTTFDEALVKECYRREQSIVPQQALALTNSGLVLDSVGPIAARLTATLADRGAAADDDAAFVDLAYLSLLGAEPTAAERSACVRTLAAWRALPEAGQGEPAARFARGQLVWVLLSHNDFVTVR